MTTSTELSKVIAPGNGSATAFSGDPLTIFSKDDLEVVHVDAAGVETTLVRGTTVADYKVTLTTPNSLPSKFTVTFPATATSPMSTGEKLVIKIDLPSTQETDLENQGGYFPDTQEQIADRAIILINEMREKMDRAIRVPIDVASVTDLPISPDPKGKFIGLDGNGNPVALSDSGIAPDVSDRTVTPTGANTARPLADFLQNAEFRLSHDDNNKANVASWDAALVKWGHEYTADRGQPFVYIDARVNDASLSGNVENDLFRTQFKSFASDATLRPSVVGAAVFGKQSGGDDGHIQGFNIVLEIEAGADGKMVGMEIGLNNTEGTDTGANDFADTKLKKALALNAGGGNLFGAVVLQGGRAPSSIMGLPCAQIPFKPAPSGLRTRPILM